MPCSTAAARTSSPRRASSAAPQSAPGLPYATRIGAGARLVAQLRAGLSRAFADPDLRTVREALLIDGLEVLDPTAYDCMAEMEAAAKRQRYLELD